MYLFQTYSIKRCVSVLYVYVFCSNAHWHARIRIGRITDLESASQVSFNKISPANYSMGPFKLSTNKFFSTSIRNLYMHQH